MGGWVPFHLLPLGFGVRVAQDITVEICVGAQVLAFCRRSWVFASPTLVARYPYVHGFLRASEKAVKQPPLVKKVA